ncbi:MAG: carbamate kinase [Candidatus Micrarchaeota archaeon]|nr:carbamate kinase [Candidatus Micrarchaeota archaeon]
MKTIVIGLGGNALLSPSGRQDVGSEMRNAAKVAAQIARVAATGRYRIIITHGNGPQIGDELSRNMHAGKDVPALPFYIMSSETEAQIGTVLELALRNELAKLGKNIEVAAVLTHVLVDPDDKAFRNPSKPIGPFMRKKSGNGVYRKFQNGYRLVVPSPIPKQILETASIRDLSDKGIVIACGGGGVPVIRKGKRYVGVAGVIDKDRATQLLASAMGADMMLLLTDVDYVYTDYGRKTGMIMEAKSSILKKNLRMFEEGTIRPKVEACIEFVESGKGTAYIGSLEKLELVLEGKSGTRIS